MNKNSKDQINIDKKILLCWKCGFPNKIGDMYCMYCRSPLGRKLNLISRLEIFLAQRKWRKVLSKRKARAKGANRFITLTIGIILFLGGCYLFTKAIFTNSFTNWMISLLFLTYSVFSVKFFLSRKEQKPD